MFQLHANYPILVTLMILIIVYTALCLCNMIFYCFTLPSDTKQEVKRIRTHTRTHEYSTLDNI